MLFYNKTDRAGYSFFLVSLAFAIFTTAGQSETRAKGPESPKSVSQNGVSQGAVAVSSGVVSVKSLTIRQQLLITPLELEKRIGEVDLLILDTRSFNEYSVKHIPNAVWAKVSDWKKKGHRPSGLTDTAYWSKAIGTLGIGPKTKVVVYGDKSPTSTARVWWHLKYAGVKEVQLLDGGWGLWLAEKKTTSQVSPQIGFAKFQAKFQTKMLASTADVLAVAKDTDKKVKLVDSRSPGEFTRHIPGAINVEWKELLNVKGQFKSQAELRKIFERQHVLQNQKVITYCQSGGRASLEVLGLMLAGHEEVQNYYGSWMEWTVDKKLPVQ